MKEDQNMKVEIIVLPVEEKSEQNDFFKFRDCINEKETEILLQSLKESRQIDESGW